MESKLVEFARRGQVIAMAGAGVSAGKPSELPSWKPLNATIFKYMIHRLESSLNRPGWLAEVAPLVHTVRDTDRFPPEYQAQLIEEMCGERYFRALQALDVDVRNTSHNGIAALAAAGALKAVVTTNFDRLIEQALDERGVKYLVAYDDAGFLRINEHLRLGRRLPIPIIKIHGCVSAHLSMIDTLKQRKRGRARHLQDCLDALQSGYWLYLGFSAADLDSNPDYLGLVAGATHSAGATYIAYPKSPLLGKGARMLMDAFGDRGNDFPADIAAQLEGLCSSLGAPGAFSITEDNQTGQSCFETKLKAWTERLSPAAAGLCIAAILEAIGQAEPAVRILDRLVRNELHYDRDTPDFRALQLQYGRLGAAWGRFIAVPDLNGKASNASVETVQSLLRLSKSEAGFAAQSWLATGWLWLNDGQQATDIAKRLMRYFFDGQWEGPEPRSDEEAVDGWLSGTQVFVLNASQQTVDLVVNTSEKAIERAKRSGDVIRTARVAAMELLAMAATTEDVPSLVQSYNTDFTDAQRVADGFALGMCSLALGRWYVGAGGLASARTVDAVSVTRRALEHLEEAVVHFRRQGMDPWELFAFVQQAKAYADLHQFDEAQNFIDEAVKGLERFPVFASHIYDAAGQIKRMQGDPESGKSFEAALNAAEQSGLLLRRQSLLRYMRQNEQGQQQKSN